MLRLEFIFTLNENKYADTFMKSFQGMMKIMLQEHMEFQIVTPRTLKDFNGDLLILSDAKRVSAAEVSLF